MLLNKIVKIPRREVAGASTTKRLDFQKHWPFVKSSISTSMQKNT
jgi:hypothetical protein